MAPTLADDLATLYREDRGWGFGASAPSEGIEGLNAAIARLEERVAALEGAPHDEKKRVAALEREPRAEVAATPMLERETRGRAD